MDQAKFMEDSHKKFEVRGHALKISAPKRGRGSARSRQLRAGGEGGRSAKCRSPHLKKNDFIFFIISKYFLSIINSIFEY